MARSSVIIPGNFKADFRNRVWSEQLYVAVLHLAGQDERVALAMKCSRKSLQAVVLWGIFGCTQGPLDVTGTVNLGFI